MASRTSSSLLVANGRPSAMRPSIHLDNIGKRYHVGRLARREDYRTLRDSLASLASAPLRRWRQGAVSNNSEEFWALQGVSFEVRPGEVVGIIGRNGAGKSTLLKILSRITRPTTGHVALRGRVGSLLEVGTGFHPELTGRENIYLNGSILGMSRHEITRRFDDIVTFADVTRFLDTPVKRYSSGMSVRLAFAVAAHLEPEILLIDEVLAVGDAQFQRKCIGRIKSISQQGRTVLFVSHNMAAVLNLCQRGILISHGGVESDGPVSSVVETYTRTLATPQGGRLDLKTHPSRASGCLPLIAGVSFINSRGEVTDTFGCGESLVIALEFDPLMILEQPHFGIGFDDALGQRVFSAATYLSTSTLPALRKRTTVYCRIPELPLVPGTYTLSLSAGSAGRFLMDALHNAVAIEITPTDYFGNGKMPSPQLGQILMRSQWELENESSHALN